MTVQEQCTEDGTRVTVHELKCWCEYFEAMLDGIKGFELRKDDRGFEVGDELWLREWSPISGDYSGREMRRRVTYVLRGGSFGLEPGFCILSVVPIEAPS